MNDIIVYQAGTLLAELTEQATGQRVMRATTPGEFVSIATTAIKNGMDPILNAMSQMWGTTIFSTRPYYAAMQGLDMSAERWANATRKLSVVSNAPANDPRFAWPVAYDATNHSGNPLGNGESVDMYKIQKKDVLQTVFYGQAVYSDKFTIFRDNLDVAFRSPEEFMRFNQMNLEDRSNSLETWKDALKHGLITNLAGALIKENDSSRVVHLATAFCTEYSITPGADAWAAIKGANMVREFWQWTYAKMNTIAREMAVRSVKYQTSISGKPIMRHTPADALRCYVTGQHIDQIRALAIANTYNDNYLRTVDMEGVAYWQSIDSPTGINIYPVRTKTDGTVETSDSAVTNGAVFGLMFDRDALGFATVNEWSAVTPLNVDGGYWNDAYHANVRERQDMTEKAVVLLLD